MNVYRAVPLDPQTLFEGLELPGIGHPNGNSWELRGKTAFALPQECLANGHDRTAIRILSSSVKSNETLGLSIDPLI